MKSLIKAINNLANSISKLADSTKIITPKPVSNTTTSNPYTGTSSVDITPSYISKETEGWYTLGAFEKEQLYYIYKAITIKSIDPNYTSADIAFTKVMDSLNAHWPSLHAPIYKLISLKKRSIQDKYNKRINNLSNSDFPHNHKNA